MLQKYTRDKRQTTPICVCLYYLVPNWLCDKHTLTYLPWAKPLFSFVYLPGDIKLMYGQAKYANTPHFVQCSYPPSITLRYGECFREELFLSSCQPAV